MTTVALVAVALLAGIGVAAPGLVPAAMAPAADSLLARGDDALDTVRDQGVPIPDLPQCRATTRACVDLDGDKAWLIDGGRVVRGPVDVRHGSDETPTPRGDFVVQWKAQAYTSREYLRQMPWSVFFADGGIAFHQGTFDTPSAGCVKLHEDDARAFFEFLKVGDRVQVL